VIYAVGWLFWLAAMLLVGVGLLGLVALAGVAGHLAWQVATLDISKPDNCLDRIKSNRVVGWLLTAGLIAELMIANGLRAP
jgi:4-hydroxybenzoate polyprenyltransferase